MSIRTVDKVKVSVLLLVMMACAGRTSQDETTAYGILDAKRLVMVKDQYVGDELHKGFDRYTPIWS